MSDDTQVLDIQEELRKQVATLKDTVAPPTGFAISIKGKVFTLPDGRQSAGPLECIILDHVSANHYYPGAYNPKQLTAPECFAIGRVVADLKASPNSPTVQDENNCAVCAFNQWNSDPQGGKGKACKNQRILLLVPADTKDVNAQQYVLKVAPNAIKHYDKYIDMLAKSGRHPIQLETKITFDPSEAYPSLRFALGEKVLNDEELAVMWELRKRGESLLFQEPVSEKSEKEA